MVLQRGMPIHMWGKAAPGETVQVAFKKQQKSTTADFAGRWHIYLMPEPAGGPFELRVTGQNEIVLHDVLVGDVWVASGQSNMEYPMEGWNGTPNRSAEEIPKANHPDHPSAESREGLFGASAGRSREASEVECLARRRQCGSFRRSPTYFAKEIAEREKVPIGVIESTWGGTVGGGVDEPGWPFEQSEPDADLRRTART